jgi:hypothetical protein
VLARTEPASTQEEGMGAHPMELFLVFSFYALHHFFTFAFLARIAVL